jgi:tRNA(Ile)-lysidine synthase
VLADIGINPAALAVTARRMQLARDALDYAMSQFEPALDLDCHGGLFASFDRAAFDAGPALLRQRVLARLIAGFGGDTPAPELAQIEHAVSALGTGASRSLTLGGVTISRGERLVRIWREAGRVAPDALVLTPGQAAVWDARFRVSIAADADLGDGPPIVVRALGREGLVEVRKQGKAIPDCPARAAYALPGFWRSETLLAAPQLGLCVSQSSGGGAGCATPFISEPLMATGGPRRLE